MSSQPGPAESRALTLERLASPREDGATFASPNWLGHRGRNARADALLLRGATQAELRALQERDGGWRNLSSHLGHLRKAHGLHVIREGELTRLVVPSGVASGSESRGAVAPPVDVAVAPPLAGETGNRKRGGTGRLGRVRGGRTLVPLLWIGAVCDVADAPAVDVVVPSSGRDAIALDDVVFAVLGASREAVQAVARAVCDVGNRWATAGRPGLADAERFVRGHGDWATARDPLAGSYYVYCYPEGGRTFYVGKGTGSRWLEHQLEVERLRADSVPLQQMTAKQRTIHRILDSLNGPAVRLPRLIAEFVGPHAEAQALAVENFLIRKVYGPFNLTNDTIGNSSFGNELRWLTRPGPDLAERALWKSALAAFLAQGRMQQTENLDLRWMLVSPLVDLLKARIDGEAIGELQFVGHGNKKTDVAAEWNVAGTPALIQLVFGNKTPTARINLRPRVKAWKSPPSSEDRRAFKALVARAFGAEAAREIKLPDAGGCYYKPYRRDDGRDTEFGYADEGSLSRIQVAWSEPAEIGLLGGMQRVIGKLRAAVPAPGL